MTDLTSVLPAFPTDQYVRLLPSLEKNKVTTADLITLDCVEVAKRAQLPLLDVKRLCNAVLVALQVDLGTRETRDEEAPKVESSLRKTGKDLLQKWSTISTLDDDLDRALGGGIPTGYITEVTGESGAGKTQFLLTLLLSAQLPAPYGLSCSTLYISTESALPTTRLSQLLRSHPSISSITPKPTLDSIHCIVVSDLEAQDHILRFHVPVQIRARSIRLIILDSVAANYRAELERPGASGIQTHGANMAQRSSDLVKLGQLLRDLAREHNIAVVVANQVADRFSAYGGGGSSTGGGTPRIERNATQSSPLARRSGPASSIAAPPDSSGIPVPSQRPFSTTPDPLSLDHQQRWFTGWGDDTSPYSVISKNMKTPALGLIWTTQIACRIALIKRPVYGRKVVVEDEDSGPTLKRWRRWMKVVFAPHVSETGSGLGGAVEFEITGSGMKAVKKNIDGAGTEYGDGEEEVELPLGTD
ncbi:hypothetical protein HYFRA_00000897 [Hymenoscyphus fraxineus]|uniref:RecA family profile 1 domain-containing protein n=1 Tax=Hymenoscyphus fraxineus TaxID=746836 RepID=A0A9N9KSG5_9HELO|nr:hypothetical protein HYFRA_00000897 [Hymenoscyphus fraxineus]